MNKEEKIKVANLIKKIRIEFTADLATRFAYDILLQSNEGLFNETYSAWESYLIDMVSNNGLTSTERNGIWVPAIPL